MSKKTLKISLFVLILVSTGILLKDYSQKPPSQPQAELPILAEPSASPSAAQRASSLERAPRFSPHPEDAPVSQIAPTRDQVREEVARDPHLTPPSLLVFARQMGEKFKTAKLSEDNARSFYKELEDCLTSSELQGADSAQALCLRDAQRLRMIFPVLQPDFARLSAESNPTVQKLVLHLSDD